MDPGFEIRGRSKQWGTHFEDLLFAPILKISLLPPEIPVPVPR
jgi:hypothetical protein